MKSYDEALRDSQAAEIMEEEKKKLQDTLDEILEELEEEDKILTELKQELEEFKHGNEEQSDNK